jgi:uridylate kinase
MNQIVLSVGGSLIVPDEIQVNFLSQFRELILKHVAEYQFVIYAGGGSIARRYMTGASAVTELTPDQLDWLGIHASRLNGQLLRTLFGDQAEAELIVDPTLELQMSKPIQVGAGWKPGWSTDYDAVAVAAANGINRVVNLSNIPYVYDKDPKQHHDAQPIEETTWPEFQKLVGDTWTPGMSAPFDPIAAKLAAEHGIEVIIADGVNIPNVEAILTGQPFAGTRIHA